MRNLPELYRYGMSFNKLCDYAASGRPILFAGAPGHNLVEKYQCGIVVPPEDPPALSEAIHRFLDMADEDRAAMGRNAIECARQQFDMETLARRLEDMLLAVAREWADSPGQGTARRNVPSTQPDSNTLALHPQDN
jgi:glycosyltransferase involved in cell wall biosynthesis